MEVLAETKFLRFVQNDGWAYVTRKKHSYVEGNHNADGVVIIAYHPDKDKYVVIKQYRKSIGGFIYEFPAGLIDIDELPKEAAIREFREETGMFLYVGKYDVPVTHPSVGATDETLTIIYGTAHGEPSTDGNEGDENIEVEFWGNEDFVKAMLTNSIDTKLATFFLGRMAGK